MSFIPAIILSCLIIVAEASLYNFIYIGECVLGYNPVVQLLHHGCYCGFGNFGDNVTAEDGYDRCCKEHDKCYGDLVNKSHECRSTLEEYLLPYIVGCPRECTATCYVPFPISMSSSLYNCSMGLCRCDIKMLECWRNVQWSGEKNGDRPDKRICRNGGEKPPMGVQDEGTWFQKLLTYLEFKGNVPRSKYLEVNSTENFNAIPESKCQKYANTSIKDKKVIDRLHNEISRRHESELHDVYGNVESNDIISFVDTREV